VPKEPSFPASVDVACPGEDVRAIRVSTTIWGGSDIPRVPTLHATDGVRGVISNAEIRRTDEPARADPLSNGVGIESNDAAANRGPLKLPALPTVANDNCEELEGVLGTEVKAVEDGGVVVHVSSSMGGRLPRALACLDPTRKQVRTQA
jgi:hypothetical protein